MTYSEPTGLWQPDGADGHDRDLAAQADDGLHVSTGYAAGEDMRGENAVFGLIDTAAAGQALAQHARGKQREPGASDVAQDQGVHGDVNRDVIQALHDQYWRALDNPQASLAADWAEPAALASGSRNGASSSTDEGADDQAEAQSTEGWSIEALLSGTRRLEDVFGPFRKGEVPEAEVEPIPEILRLFAPAEYLAAASRRPPALPAALTRREHHSLGIDSPLPAPDSTTHHDTL
ncbi:TagK domain-containing protein [Paraburkholderia sp. SIMBA_030]|uniref:TagK domain-containing protein n=1 Tax=Paraburkholderia sp. SIMBA_030 TaxID=3085773 RepID=UPI00397B9F46